jgi:CrcB protein
MLAGAGGAIGSIARVALDGLVQRLVPSTFPAGIFVVNVIGCLAFGLAAGVADARGGLSPSARMFVMAGILGGFTTFSTFTSDTLALLRAGDAGRALFNAGGQVVVGLVALWAGLTLSRGATF